MNFSQPFQNEITQELDGFLSREETRFPTLETLTIDLHCHDRNSNVPDELIARILNVPETWLSTDDLMRVLREHGCDTFTVTNHNNARSCYDLIERGHDVLVGAEFSCMVPDFKTGIHVLAYGFTPEQESKLNKLRGDVYSFQKYANEIDIPTIWAHPLYHYKSDGVPPMEFFDTMSLIFERFETVNGQRDSWQNMMVKVWIESLTEEKIRSDSLKFRIDPAQYCRHPYRKSMSGGSDSHMGIFTGLTGTRLHVPGLESMKNPRRPELALEAIREGRMAPFGSHNDAEKMAITFMDYFCQIGLNMKDPGLFRMLLHKGKARDKLISFAVANGFSELKRHRTTLNFLKIFHDCFSGKVPGFGKKLIVPKRYKEVFNLASTMAVKRRDDPEHMLEVFDDSIRRIYTKLNGILLRRLEQKMTKMGDGKDISSIDIEKLIEHLELPSNVRSLFEPAKGKRRKGASRFNMSEFLDGLSFPFLASAVIGAAFFTSARVMYKSRSLLEVFSKKLGVFKHPHRTLWLTDTFEDSNGVATVLKSMLHEIRKRDMPIDLCAVSSTLQSQDHLVVIPPVREFKLPFYEQQPLRIPDLLQVHKLFQEGEYSRIICSTEGPMGLMGLYLKLAYSVPAYFYLHTDWMTFAEKSLNFNEGNRSQLRRILRAFYRSFDGLFVLNGDQRKWLTGSSMGLDPSRVFLTAHWADSHFKPMDVRKERIFNVGADTPVLLFAGRLSEEKGVMDLPTVLEKVRAEFPDTVMVFAGTGPSEQALKKTMPDAIFLGWVEGKRLPEIYSAADLLLLPSRFDTFGCVVLEALSCSLPVVAYKSKGPKDILNDGVNGYLVKGRAEMAARIIDYLGDKRRMRSFREESLKRAGKYDPDTIVRRFFRDLHSVA